jgi:hypothetical protein
MFKGAQGWEANEYRFAAIRLQLYTSPATCERNPQMWVRSDLLLAWRSAHLGVFVVGCLQTTLLCGPTCSVRSGLIAMISEAYYSDNLRPALD